MIEREYAERKAFLDVQRETIDTIDKIANHPSFDEQFEQFFTKSLGAKIREHATLKTQGEVFLKEMSVMLQLLTEIRLLPEGAEYEDDRTIATLKLMVSRNFPL